MDNRIANDMISSGMIPSGEKKKEDLGRTQYGSAPSPNALLDAYKSMYDKKEEVINEHHKKDADGNTIPHEGEELNEGKIPAGLQAYLDKKKGKKEDKKDVKEGNQRDPESSKKDKTYSKQPDPSKDGFTGIGNMSVNDIMKMNAKMKKDKKEVKEAAGAGMIVKGLMKSVAQGAAAQLGAQATSGLMAKKGIGGALKTVGAKVGSKIGGSAGRKLGYKAGSAIANNPMTSYYIGKDLMPGGGGGGAPQPMTKKTSSISASADLFDIVKGQLIDEGLSEEEIKDIMLTLTPDEIMSEMAVNPNIAAMDAKNKADMIARAQANKVPDKVKEASKRQMKAGTPREDKNNPYTTQDKKTIIDYNKNK